MSQEKPVWVSLILLAAMPLVYAAEQHPVFRDPSFHFSDVETICVMPVVDGWNDPDLSLDFGITRPLVMQALEARGYRIADPGCSEKSLGGQVNPASPRRWSMAIRIDRLVNDPLTLSIVGATLTASLSDTATGKEVWRDSATTGFVGIEKNELKAMLGLAHLNQALKTAVAPVLATFEAGGSGRQPFAVDWAPLSIDAEVLTMAQSAFGRVTHRETCPGTLRIESAAVSFTPVSATRTCQKWEFSVPPGEIKSYGSNAIVGAIPETGYSAFHLRVPGKGDVNFFTGDETQLNYVFAALGPRK